MVEEERSEQDSVKITRRRFTLGIMLAAVVGAFGSFLSLFKILAPQAKAGYVATVAPGDLLVYAKGARQGSVLQASAFKVGDSVLAYPKGKTTNPANIVRLIRLKESEFASPTHTGLTSQGFVAYSAICTHLGCIVDWKEILSHPTSSYLECPCHDSIFNPAQGAKVMGGPAPVPLAQIGVKVSKTGELVFTSGFTGPIGPQA